MFYNSMFETDLFLERLDPLPVSSLSDLEESLGSLLCRTQSFSLQFALLLMSCRQFDHSTRTEHHRSTGY